MFTGAEMLLISGGLNAVGTIMGIGSQYTSDKINEVVSRTNAKLAQMDAEQKAVDIRRQGAAVAGASRAALAASGVDLAGGGTVDEIERRVAQDTERDALMALLTGSRESQAYRDQAQAYDRGARDAVTAGALKIAGTTMSTAYGIDKWQRGMEA